MNRQGWTETETSYHHVVIDVPQVEDIHGALRSSSVAPWGAGGGHWALTWLASRGQLKVGTVWFPVYTPDGKGGFHSNELVSSTVSEVHGIILNGQDTQGLLEQKILHER